MLQSELLGTEEDEQDALHDVDNGLTLLDSSVAARAVKFPCLKYVSIHPWARATAMHAVGIMELVAEKLDEDLQTQMAGRAGRTCHGVVSCLCDVDDSAAALEALKQSKRATTVADQDVARASAKSQGSIAVADHASAKSQVTHAVADQDVATLTPAPPARLY